MINEKNPQTGQGQKQNPIEQNRTPGGEPKTTEGQIRRAPGSEQEYQGNQAQQKRTPGVEQDDSTEDGGYGKKESA
jgi:hypothetical protein